ncbi:hypothetical protein B9Z55_009211 [Caenorhabditis nigoni]|uniref:Uncharacterized protein n=1 Tax=Caenorhabditis nigoni TaxID=1611254 RepID=A0A2G5URC2_9PELO|nr:hypothetical protein B9Z55_009211 [Caenorhabditis nigoni]
MKRRPEEQKEVEIQMREMEAEMKKMKKELKEREVEMQKRQKVIEEQESKLLKMEASETRMRLTEKKYVDFFLEKTSLDLRKGQSQLIDELTTQLENQNEKIQLMDLQLQQNEESLKLEIREKQRGFEELRAALNIMSTEMESIQSDNRNLRDRIQSIPEAPPTQTFQRIKDSLYHKKQLNQAKEMVEKMKSCTDLVEIHQIADYEYYPIRRKTIEICKRSGIEYSKNQRNL